MINRFISILLSLVLIINLSMTNGFIYANENDNPHFQVEENSYTTEESEVESTTYEQENNEQTENVETTIIESSQNDNGTVNDFHNNENVINENEVEDNDIVEPFAVDDENNNNDYEEEPEEDIVEDDINTSNNIDTNDNETDVESTTVEEITNEATNATENNEESTTETITTTENNTTNESTITETTNDETINTAGTSNETVTNEETTNTSYETTTTENSTTATDETTIATEETTVDNTTTDTTASTEIVNVATSSDIVEEDILNTALFGADESYTIKFDYYINELKEDVETLDDINKTKGTAVSLPTTNDIKQKGLTDDWQLAWWTVARGASYGKTKNSNNQDIVFTNNSNDIDKHVKSDETSKNLYAVWKVKITFDTNGHGSMFSDTQYLQQYKKNDSANDYDDYYKENVSKKLNSINDNDVDGYTFVGWSRNQNAKYDDTTGLFKKDENYSSFQATEPMKLYAVWQEDKKKIILDTEVNDVTLTNNTKFEQDTEEDGTTKSNTWTYKNHPYSEALDLPIPERKGYNFSGWYSSTNYALNEKVIKISANTKGELKYFAKWDVKTYNITYVKNGGQFKENATINYTGKFDEDCSLPSSTDISKMGYTFDGWYKNSTFDNDKINELNKNTYEEDIILFAKWNEENYTITYKADNGSHDFNSWAAGYAQPSSRYYSEETILPTKENLNITDNTKIFKGWADINKQGVIIDKIPAYTADSITLIAKFDTTYKVTIKEYKPNESEESDKNIDIYVIKDTKIPEKYHNPTACNKKFDRYKLMGGDGNNDELEDFIIANTPITSDIVIKAKWIESSGDNTITTNKVEFNLNGIDPKPNKIINDDQLQTNQYIISGDKAIKPKDPIATGYKFLGWYSSTNADSQLFDFNTPINSETTIYAKWELIDWNINYHLNGGAWAENISPKEEYDITDSNKSGNDAVKLLDNSDTNNPNLVKNHYNFEGWYKSPTFAGNKVEDLSGRTGDLNLYAKWTTSDTASNYINFAPNGGSGYMTTQCVFSNDGDTIKLQKNEYTYAGYQFAGWTSSDGKNYIDQAEIQTSELTGNIVLTANWTPIPKKNSFPSYSGSGYYGGGSGGSGGGGGGGGSYSVHYPTINNNNPMIVQNQPVTTEQPMLIGFNNSTKEQKVNQVKWTSGIIDERTSKWVANPQTGKWQIYNKDGVKATNGFYQINNIAQIGFTQQMISDTYYFDSLGQMVTGFVTTQDNKCYYFETANNQNQGKMVRGWKQINGDYYYFNQDGSMVVNGITPDGRAVGQDGKLLKFNM